MGSVPSTPDQDSRQTNDPWWPVENQNLTLNHSPLLAAASPTTTTAVDAEEGHRSNLEATTNNSTINNEPQLIANNELFDMENDSSSSDCIDGGDQLNEGSVAKGPRSSALKDNISDGDYERRRGSREERINQSLEEFKEELRIKREKRQNAITDLRNEIATLRQQLIDEKALNRRLMIERNVNYNDSTEHSVDTHDVDLAVEAMRTNDEIVSDVPSNNEIAIKAELSAAQYALQLANAEILSLNTELTGTRRQVTSLKDVVAVTKQMVQIREDQLDKMKEKLKQIESSLAERELQLMSENLRQEYDRQLSNIRNLRALYEERARVSAAERENLNRQLDTKRAELDAEIEKNKNLEDHISTLDADLKSTTTDLFATREQLSYYKSENKELHGEMTVINQLFSQLLVGFTGNNDINIDKLTNMLEDNRDLLNDITHRECSKEGAAELPKLLFDIVSRAEDRALDQVNGTKDSREDNESVDECAPTGEGAVDGENGASEKPKVTSAQEIIRNLPKVWKVLTELLNHQQEKQVDLHTNKESEDCYKSVETPAGPQMVLSVSKTYIKLKDLIMEKKFLQKETRKLKNLNYHLDDRLREQEKRLGAVSVELSKTWNLVGRMQRQHRQLHTHEQVLRYQLQQKRRMLTELKDELAYCRRKWDLAREKNNESQSQWDTLRKEFIERKEQDSNASAESGYSDGPASDDDGPANDDADVCSKRQRNQDDSGTAASRKLLRIRSTSPRHHMKAAGTQHRRSLPEATQFATEVYQLETGLVQSINPSPAESKSCETLRGIEATASSIVTSNAAEKAQITRASVCSSRAGPSTSKSDVKKTLMVKSSGDKLKLCFENRMKNASKTVTGKKEESLEEMFCRLSGQPMQRESSSEREDEDDDDDEEMEIDIEGSESDDADEDDSVSEPNTSLNSHETLANRLASIDERRALRAARIQCLEEQCKQLILQVTRTSNRGDALNRQIDEVQKRYTPVREISDPPTRQNASTDELNTSSNVAEEPPSTSSTAISQPLPTAGAERLTASEIDYASRRSERLKCLEAECKAFLDKVTTTSSRASNIDSKLKDLHERYGCSSQDSNSDDIVGTPQSHPNLEADAIQRTGTIPNADSAPIDNASSSTSDTSLLTQREVDYTTRRAERLKRLEAECAAFMNRIKSTNSRGSSIDNKLNDLHERYGRSSVGNEEEPSAIVTSISATSDTVIASNAANTNESHPAPDAQTNEDELSSPTIDSNESPTENNDNLN